MLQVTGLKKAFGPIQALDGISLHIPQGECYALLGPNGAGKTTTINILSGLMPPDQGSVSIAGYDPAKEPNRAKQSIGVIPQEIALYDDLTARQNLIFWASLYGLPKKEIRQRAEVVLKRIGLLDRADQPLHTFSGGMKRRVNIAAAILHRPALLFMDEPTVGIDPQSRLHILELIEELHREGMTILYTTHYMEEAQRLCDRIGIMDRGRLIAEGTLRELRDRMPGKTLIRVETRGLTPESTVQLQHDYRERIIIQKEELLLNTECVHQDIAELVRQCGELHIDIQNLSVSEADLEGVFLELTGRALRD